MSYQAKDYSRLLGTPGFSDQLLKNHFTLYQGYVNNTNKLAETLKTMLKEGKSNTPEYAELKRRFGWKWNGMRLHEYYYDNLVNGGKSLDQNSDLARKINEDFGSYAEWEKEFKATGVLRGIGWVVLYLDPVSYKLYNSWINEHDVGHLAGCKLLLVLDVFEHAFMIDYGLKRADYIEAFFKNIDWSVVSSRLM